MKKLLIGLLVLILALAAAYMYFFQLSPIKKNNPLSAVPSDALVIIQLDDPLKQWQSITENKIWDFIKSNPALKTIGYSIDSLNTEIKKNTILWDLVASRPMVISAHRIKDKKIDFLYTIDLQKATQLKFFKNYIEKVIGSEAKVYTRKYGNTEIIEFSYFDSAVTYYLSVSENLLIVSQTHTLIESSISERVSPLLIRDLDFIEVGKYLNVENITVYLNHKELVNYSTLLMQNENAYVKDLASSKYTSINFEMTDDFVTIKGFSNLSDSDASLFKALTNSGKSEVSLGEIVPEYASSFLSLNFSNADTFYKNLLNAISESDQSTDFFRNKEKLEKYLHISFEKDFIGWMTNEIGVIQLNSSTNKSTIEVAVAIKHKGVDITKNSLDHIENQIKKKTPVKFKAVDYKGYRISYLSIKGFFKIFFGKLFKQIDKPYYVVLDDYVIFSNSPKTLGKIITAEIENKTLDNKAHYSDFMNRFNPESNLFVYFDTKNLLIDAKRLLDPESFSAIQKNKKYIEGFPLLGIQMSEYDGLIAHTIDLEYFAQSANVNFKDKKEAIYGPETTQLELTTESDENLISVENILPEDLNDKTLKESFANGQVKFEVPLKEGRKHGRYTEYDSLGNLIIKGRFKDDKKTGTWKFYDAKGELKEKIKY